jgi:hypothetical protein
MYLNKPRCHHIGDATWAHRITSSPPLTKHHNTAPNSSEQLAAVVNLSFLEEFIYIRAASLNLSRTVALGCITLGLQDVEQHPWLYPLAVNSSLPVGVAVA